jgi:hypothetical protein
MFKPVFPYKGNQVVLTSDRVTIHSKTDAIFIFGKQAVSLSSVKTINLDANEAILLYSTTIELGPRAKVQGQPVVLGTNLNQQLISIMNSISNAGMLLSQVSETDLGASFQYIASAGGILSEESSRLIQTLQTNFILSKNTFTR